MTDSSQLLPNNVGLTSDLLFNLKPSSGRGRSYRCSVQPTNASTFAPGSTAILYIPCGRRATFLDPQQSYIKYTVVNNETTASSSLNFDNSGASVINRLDVFHASNQLESIQTYNVLYNILLDFTVNQGQRIGCSNHFGFSAGYTIPDSSRSGAVLGVGASTNNRLTVCMPILSGVVGMLLDKMLPVGALNDDIRLEFTFEQNAVGMVFSGTNQTAWSIVGVELELTYIELEDDTMSIVNSVTPLNGEIYMHGSSYRHYVSTVPTSTSGTFSTLVPQRFASTKGLLLAPRRSTELTDGQSYSLSSRINPNIDQYWFRLGSLLIPQKYVTLKNSSVTTAGYAEGFQEVMKYFHSTNHPELSGVMAFPNFHVANTADTTVGSGGVIAPSTGANSWKNGFLIGQNFETYAQKGDVIISGVNTLSAQTFFECNINTATSSTATYTLDFYTNYDHILVKDTQGILSVRF
jgi:hypothetical protein